MNSHEHVPAGTAGPTVLDIGGNTGALVVHMHAGALGEEIEIEPADGSGRRTHVAVLERRVAGRTVYAAVFPALAQGVHTLFPGVADSERDVAVAGGVVTEVSGISSDFNRSS